MRMKLISSVLTFAFFVHTVGHSQTFSSYSALGIGNINNHATVQHLSMGGLGISNGSYYYQNTLNPSLLVDNQVYSFGGGLTFENKKILQGDNHEVASGGTLSYLNMIIPVSPGKFVFSIGLFPYSNVNYNFKTDTPVLGNPDSEVVALSIGEGGFNQFVFKGAGKITENLYIGGEIAYLFSSISKEKNVTLVEPFGPYVPASKTLITANDFVYSLGFVYRIPVNDDIKISLGSTYGFSKDLTVTKFKTIQTNSFAGTPIKIDTLLDNASGFISIPASYGIGISVAKLNNWMFGTDIKFQNWDNYRDFDGQNNNLTSAMTIIVGGEITPNISSFDNYFERITYRFGFNYENTPYIINNLQIEEFGINFGLSLPVTNFSSVDMGFRYGAQGTLKDNLIKESFTRIYFGFTFNDNRWFVRPKFN